MFANDPTRTLARLGCGISERGSASLGRTPFKRKTGTSNPETDRLLGGFVIIMSSCRRSERPGETHRQIGSVNQSARKPFVQAYPFGAHVRWQTTMEQIRHLERVGHEIVEFVFDTAAVDTEINRVGPVALT